MKEIQGVVLTEEDLGGVGPASATADKMNVIAGEVLSGEIREEIAHQRSAPQ